MGRGFVVMAGVTAVVLLVIIVAAIGRLLVLLVHLVTLRYTLALGALVCTFWLVHSRRQRYAKGFYSCSRVPSMQSSQHVKEKTVLLGGEHEQEEEKMQAMATVNAPALLEMLPGHQKKMAPPSETESEEDDREAVGGGEGGEISVGRKTGLCSTSFSRHSLSLMDVRTRSHTTDGHVKRQEATRPRSSSTSDDSRPSRVRADGNWSRTRKIDGMEKKRRVVRGRADTGVTTHSKQTERSRRATFASKHDADMTAHRLSSDKVEDALRLNGYWIGDFRVQRQLAPRRGHTTSPKAT